jgi:hypothetical protein
MRIFSYRLGEGSPRVGAYRDGVPVDLGPGDVPDLLQTRSGCRPVLKPVRGRLIDPARTAQPSFITIVFGRTPRDGI